MDRSFLFEAAFLDERDFYFFSKDYNAFFKYDIDNSNVVFLGNIPEYSFDSSRLCGDIHKYKDELWLVPFCGNELWKYKLNKKEWSSFDIFNNKEQHKFWDSLLYNNMIIMFGHSYHGIVIYNIDENTHKIIKIPELEQHKTFFGVNSVLIDNVVYLACCCCPKVIKLNLNTFQYSIISLDYGNGFMGIAYDGEYFYLSCTEDNLGKMYKLNYDFSVIEEKDALNVTPFGIVANNNEVIWGSYLGAKSGVYKEEAKQYIHKNYSYIKKRNNKIVIQDESGLIQLYDGINAQNINIRFNRESVKDSFRNYKSYTLNESDEYSLSVFLDSI